MFDISFFFPSWSPFDWSRDGHKGGAESHFNLKWFEMIWRNFQISMIYISNCSTRYDDDDEWRFGCCWHCNSDSHALKPHQNFRSWCCFPFGSTANATLPFDIVRSLNLCYHLVFDNWITFEHAQNIENNLVKCRKYGASLGSVWQSHITQIAFNHITSHHKLNQITHGFIYRFCAVTFDNNNKKNSFLKRMLSVSHVM